ncbi:hypothetical protein BD779DRAFT_1530596 [Infundibulicybe gibba]|nr:hypothetical protein BD779DRAFT_1530596 [Infundibulicybe gibba]
MHNYHQCYRGRCLTLIRYAAPRHDHAALRGTLHVLLGCSGGCARGRPCCCCHADSCNFLVTITMIYKVLQRVEDLGDPSCESECTSQPRLTSLSVIPTTIVLTDLSDLAPDGSPHSSIRYSTTSAADSVQGSLTQQVHSHDRADTVPRTKPPFPYSADSPIGR